MLHTVNEGTSLTYKLVLEFENREQQSNSYNIFTNHSDQKHSVIHHTKNKSSDSFQDWRTSDIMLERVNITKKKNSESDKDIVTSEYLGHGIIKLFKSGTETDKDDAETKDIITVPGEDTMVSILFVPTYFTIHDLLHYYIGDEIVNNQVSDFRILRNKQKGFGFNFMVLMKFRESTAAKNFKDEFNGKRFSKMDPETCHVAYIKEIIFAKKLFPGDEKKELPYLLNDPFTTVRENTNADHDVELPTCPVCLERMDSETTGLITIPCQHTFHCQCLDKWKNSKCPVCRLSSFRLSRDTLRKHGNKEKCSECGSSENLWICLICGHVGCGRYNSRHAIKHFEETSHCFAMDSKTDRVWDYAGDNYVHRLVENEVDGKLVESVGRVDDRKAGIGSSFQPSTSNNYKDDDDKDLRVNFMRNREYHLEYVEVLISQLESQSEYYEMKMQDTYKMTDEIENLNQKLKDMQKENKNLKEVVDRNDQIKKDLESKIIEDKLIIKGLQENLAFRDEKIETIEQRLKDQEEQNKELQDQLKDIMFYLESRDKFDQAPDEVKEGTILVQPGVTTTKSKKKRNKKKVPKLPPKIDDIQ
ncbi:RING finger protein ETP1 [Nakaseomyces glabratus]|nr:RING finger protein ETP1 [Nakaseomyces glabratus]KTB24939.1 RING finger protein ETP1 [Nakaseomyces glabratus]